MLTITHARCAECGRSFTPGSRQYGHCREHQQTAAAVRAAQAAAERAQRDAIAASRTATLAIMCACRRLGSRRFALQVQAYAAGLHAEALARRIALQDAWLRHGSYSLSGR